MVRGAQPTFSNNLDDVWKVTMLSYWQRSLSALCWIWIDSAMISSHTYLQLCIHINRFYLKINTFLKIDYILCYGIWIDSKQNVNYTIAASLIFSKLNKCSVEAVEKKREWIFFNLGHGHFNSYKMGLLLSYYFKCYIEKEEDAGNKTN